jgi:hypothetical protein
MSELDYLPAIDNHGNKVNQAAYDWLLWFFTEADFGPADSDVREIMQRQYKTKTGGIIPSAYKVE